MAPHVAEQLTSAFIASEKSLVEPVVTELIPSTRHVDHTGNGIKHKMNGLAPLTEVQPSRVSSIDLERTEHHDATIEQTPKPKLSAGKPPSGSTKLRKMLEETNDLIVCPGVYDGISARAAQEVGFNAMYMVCLHIPLVNAAR